MINHRHQVQAPFRSRTVAEDRTPLHHPQERTGFIRYVLAQVAVVAGLVHGIVENDPYFVVGVGGVMHRKLRVVYSQDIAKRA